MIALRRFRRPLCLIFALSAAACASNAETPPDPPAPCAIGVFAKNCAATGLCHAPRDSPNPGDIPAILGFDLSPSGIKAANDGASFVGRKASDDPAGGCGAGAMPPVMGKVIVDANDPQASLLYDKLGSNPSCGQHMPLIGKALSASDKQCVLDWIEQLPGVGVDGGGR